MLKVSSGDLRSLITSSYVVSGTSLMFGFVSSFGTEFQTAPYADGCDLASFLFVFSTKYWSVKIGDAVVASKKMVLFVNCKSAC